MADEFDEAAAAAQAEPDFSAKQDAVPDPEAADAEQDLSAGGKSETEKLADAETMIDPRTGEIIDPESFKAQALRFAGSKDITWVISDDPELLGKQLGDHKRFTDFQNRTVFCFTNEEYKQATQEGGALYGKEKKYKIASQQEALNALVCTGTLPERQAIVNAKMTVDDFRANLDVMSEMWERGERARREAEERLKKQLSQVPFHEFLFHPLNSAKKVFHVFQVMRGHYRIAKAKSKVRKQIKNYEKKWAHDPEAELAEKKEGVKSVLNVRSEETAKKVSTADFLHEKRFRNTLAADQARKSSEIRLDKGQTFFDPEQAKTGKSAKPVTSSPNHISEEERNEIHVNSADHSLFPDLQGVEQSDGTLTWHVPKERYEQALQSGELKGKLYTASNNPAKMTSAALKAKPASQAATRAAVHAPKVSAPHIRI